MRVESGRASKDMEALEYLYARSKKVGDLGERSKVCNMRCHTRSSVAAQRDMNATTYDDR